MKRLSFLMLFVAAILLSGGRASCESIVIGAEDDWVPYSMADGTGMANDLVRAAFKAVGIEVEFRVMPYSRLLKLVEWGELVAGFNVPLDREIQNLYILGQTPLFEAVSFYYQSKGNPLKAKNRDELVNQERIGVVMGYGYGDHFLKLVEDRKVVKEDARSEATNLKKMAAGRIDATILYDKTGGRLIRELELQDQVERTFINETTPIFVAFSKMNEKSGYYAAKLDEGLAKIKESGEYEKILDSY